VDLSNYDQLFQDAGREWNVDPTLLKAMAAQESSGDPRAVSKPGAQGLMQIMPATQTALGVTDPNDPVQSIYGGAKYLSQALDAEKTPEDALRYYHGGPDWRTAYGPESAAYAPAVTARYVALTKAAAPVAAAPQATPPAAPVQEAAAVSSTTPAPSSAPAGASTPAPDPFGAAMVAAPEQDAPANPTSAPDDPFSGALKPVPEEAAVSAAPDAALPPNHGLVASILRGVHSATDIPANALASGADYIANKLGFHPGFAQSAADTAAPFTKSYDADPENQGWEPAAGRLAGEALVTIPAALGPESS
jgi:hypothetical protein